MKDTTVYGGEPFGCVNRAPNFAPLRPTPDMRRVGNSAIKIALATIPASRTPSRSASDNATAACPNFAANWAADDDVPTGQDVARVRAPAPGHWHDTVANSPTPLPKGLYLETSTDWL